MQPADDALSQIVSQASQQIRGETKARLEIGDGQTGLDHDSTWVKEMKWAMHFVGKNLVEIYDAAHQPGLTSLLETITPESTQDERDYARHVALLYESFDREVDRCSWRVDSVPKETLQCLGGITKGQPSGNPFTVQKQDRSCNKYLTVARRYLAFCWRAYSMGRTSAKEKLGMVFTDEQWGLMVDIALELENDELRIRGASNIVHSSDYKASDDSGIFDVDDNYSDVGSDDGQDRTDRAGELPPLETLGLDQVVFRFMAASIKTKVAGAMYRNSLLCFCAAAGVRKQPLGYYEVYLYTAVLAALQWTMRIFFLELCFQDELRDVDSITYDAMEAFRLQHEE
ncbi:hypothetical protein VHEMI09247 [[Torrubiella] hemipterigena]|uniref:Uncharacterized protein n=1 Tax=[Torrubiella] hemipterigena TaxID=1531966 RepID=A0A0A1T9F1_9HYPO|nr:hypothetical protein VHEMI09247 [[Torrubiella] hemipterigena]